MRGVDSARPVVSNLITKLEIRFYRPPGTRRTGTVLDREWRATGSEDVLWAQVSAWEETGYLPSSWHHAEPGTSFEAIGPPGTTVRLYYAKHARQVVLLHAARGKSGRGKLLAQTKTLVEQRLKMWKEWFPHGADIDDDDHLVARPKK